MRKVAVQMILAVAALALVLPVLAKSPKPDAKPKTVRMNFYSQTNLAGTMVNPGAYKLVFESEKLTVENGDNNKVVASVPGHWEDRKQKSSSTGFTSENGQVKEIMLEGDSSVFVLGQS